MFHVQYVGTSSTTFGGAEGMYAGEVHSAEVKRRHLATKVRKQQ